MYNFFCILVLLSLVVCFSQCERLTRIEWWFGKLKDDFRIDDEQIFNGLNNPQQNIENTTIVDKRLSRSNLQGTYCISRIIDGIYRCSVDTHLEPDEVLYKKYSEISSKWITKQRWRFYREDVRDEGMDFYEHVNLIFEGLDTLIDLTIHKCDLHTWDNMFIKQIISIKECLNQPYSFISVITDPPVSKALHAYNVYLRTGRLNPSCPPSIYNGDCHVNMIRKMQSSFGSIIGPSIPSMGISGPGFLEGYNETSIRHIVNNLEEKDGKWNLNISVYFAANKRNVINGSIEINIVGQIVKEDVIVRPNTDKEYVYQKIISIPKDKVKQWWPVGYGDQSLYDLKVKFVSFRGEETSRTIPVGFRTIELVQDKVGNGTSFYFKVNGRSIFMKGTILAPISLQPELAQDPKKIRSILSLAVKHNMNMIRIWGGGIYQTDAFYNMADEMGLLIWQDFMFLDTSYPTDKDFLTNVREEIKYQVRRLYNHPSVAIFCGNDEGELSIAENRFNQSKYNVTKNDYHTLFIQTVKSEFDKVTFGKGIFISSTPSNINSASEITKNPNSPFTGDGHVFKYDDDPFNHDTYTPVPRFASSYGIQSMPKTESFIKDTTYDNDKDIDSEFMASRQHWADGFKRLKKMMEYQFVLGPPDSWDWELYAQIFIYNTQVIQAYGMKIQTEKYRSHRGFTEKDGTGKTMGALYWHFNDVWTAPTWSGIDYFGQWKMFQYFVPKFFAPHIITGQLSKNSSGITSLKLFVVADATGLSNVQVNVKTARWDSLGTNTQFSMKVSVDADSSKLIYTIDNIDDYLSKRKCSRKDCFFYLELLENGKAIAPENFILPNPLKDSNIGHPKVQIHVKKLPYVQVYEVTIVTDKNVAFVWLDAHNIDGYFSDNGLLIVTSNKKVFFYSSVSTTEETVQNKMTCVYIGYKWEMPP